MVAPRPLSVPSPPYAGRFYHRSSCRESRRIHPVVPPAWQNGRLPPCRCCSGSTSEPPPPRACCSMSTRRKAPPRPPSSTLSASPTPASASRIPKTGGSRSAASRGSFSAPPAHHPATSSASASPGRCTARSSWAPMPRAPADAPMPSALPSCGTTSAPRAVCTHRTAVGGRAASSDLGRQRRAHRLHAPQGPLAARTARPLRTGAHHPPAQGFIRYRFTGELATDVSDAAGTLALDVDTRTRGSNALLDSLHLDPALLPPIHESCTIAGLLSEWAAAQTGLALGTPIVAGAGDNQAGAIGAGVVTAGEVLAALGTSGVIYAHTDRPRRDLPRPAPRPIHRGPTAHDAQRRARPATRRLVLTGCMLSAGGSPAGPAQSRSRRALRRAVRGRGGARPAPRASSSYLISRANAARIPTRTREQAGSASPRGTPAGTSSARCSKASPSA